MLCIGFRLRLRFHVSVIDFFHRFKTFTKFDKLIQSMIGDVKTLNKHHILPHRWTSKFNNIAKLIIIELVSSCVVWEVLEIIASFDDSSNILAHF